MLTITGAGAILEAENITLTLDEFERILNTWGLKITKSKNTPKNLGKTPELCLLSLLNQFCKTYNEERNMFKMKIQTDNSAFDDGKEREVAGILRTLADKIEKGFEEGVLYDSNGNKVGKFSLE